MWCGVTPLQSPSPSCLGETTPSLCGLCKNKWEKEPPQEGETAGLRGWWLGRAVQGLQQMEGWPGDACPSVPAVSQPPAAAQQLRLGPSPQPNTALGAFVPCPPAVPHPPGPARPQLPGGMTLCPPGWAPQRWFPLPEQTKRRWKGWARRGKGRDRHRATAGTWLRTRALWHGQGWGQRPWAWGQGLGQG